VTDLVPTLGQLAIPGVEVSRTGLRFLDPDLPYETWAEILRAAAEHHSFAKFAVGDALAFGEKAYGERFAQAVGATGLAEQTLTNWSYVCRQVARSRRRENLRFSHHAEVASLEPAEQDEWLDTAETNGWSVRELRDRLRDARPPRRTTSEPRWTGDEPPTPAATPAEVDEAREHAEKTLRRTLPDGHPLWRTQAEARARDVLALAPAARAGVEGEAPRLLQTTELGLLKAAVRRLVEVADGIGVGQGFARVPWEELQELAALAAEGEEAGRAS